MLHFEIVRTIDDTGRILKHGMITLQALDVHWALLGGLEVAVAAQTFPT